MEDNKVKRIVAILAAHQAYVIALSSALHQQGFETPQLLKTLRVSFGFWEQYQQSIQSFLDQPTAAAPDQEEMELWKALNLGDLWSPSTGREPGEASS